MNQYNQDQPWSRPWYLNQDGRPMPMDNMPQMMYGGWGANPWTGNPGGGSQSYGMSHWGMEPNGMWMNQTQENDMVRELTYWQEHYPEKIKRLQKYVEEVCDKVDYDDSMIYDEQPDAVALQQLANHILERAMEDTMLQPLDEDMEEMVEEMVDDENLYEAKQLHGRPGRPGGPGCPGGHGCPPPPPHPPRPPRPPRRPKRDSWLTDIVPVLLFEELFKRRCNHRNCRRKFF